MTKGLFGVMILAYSLIMCASGSSPSSATLRADDTQVTFSHQVVRIFKRIVALPFLPEKVLCDAKCAL
jgi:hypothetical protein